MTDSDETRTALRHAATAAFSLAAAMPRLVLEARRAALGIYHGLHGRRRAGPGENFWQYRPFTSGEAASRVDWRRSGRDDRLYVREREWEAAHTVWLWPDRSPSMDFIQLGRERKIERAIVVALALAELLVDGGERVGIPGLLRPTSSRAIMERMAEAILADDAPPASLPPDFAPARRAEVVLLSDFWSSEARIQAASAALASRNVRAHWVQIVDPAEEAFPYAGRVEFVEPEGAGSVIAGRAESWRTDYQARLAAHRAMLRALAAQHDWSFTIHRTDHPASELLLGLHARMSMDARSTA